MFSLSRFLGDKGLIPDVDTVSSYKMVGLFENVDTEEIQAICLVRNYRKNKLIPAVINRSEINSKTVSKMLIDNMSYGLSDTEATMEARKLHDMINEVIKKPEYPHWYYSHEKIGFVIRDDNVFFQANCILNNEEYFDSVYFGNFDIEPKGDKLAIITLLNKLIDDKSNACYFLPIGAASCVLAFSNLEWKTAIYNFLVHLASTDSSSGKSTVGRLLASFGANPFYDEEHKGLFMSLSGTQKGVIKAMSGVSGYPFILDESSSKSDKEELSSFIYLLSDGKDFLRCSAFGRGTEKVDTFRSVIVSTGESGVLKFCKKNEGLKARCYEVLLDSYTNSMDESNYIVEVIKDNYAIITPMLARKLMDESEKYKKIREEWVNRIRRRIQDERIRLGIAGRVTDFLSIIMTGAVLFNESLRVELNIEDIFEFWYQRMIFMKSLDTNMATQVYNRIKILVSENYNHFYNLSYMTGVPSLEEGQLGWEVDISYKDKKYRKKGPNGAYYDTIYIFEQDFLENYLEDSGFEDGHIAMRSLIKEKLLVRSHGDRATYDLKVETMPNIPTYAIYFQKDIPTVMGDTDFMLLDENEG